MHVYTILYTRNMASILKVRSAQVKLWLFVNFLPHSLLKTKKMRESQQDNRPLFCKQFFFKSKVYNHNFFSAFKIIMKFRQQYKSAWCGPRKTHWRVQWGRLQRGEYLFETILVSSKHIALRELHSYTL